MTPIERQIITRYMDGEAANVVADALDLRVDDVRAVLRKHMIRRGVPAKVRLPYHKTESSPWPPKKVSLLAGMGHLSAGQAAHQLTRLGWPATKNSVIGKRWRLAGNTS